MKYQLTAQILRCLLAVTCVLSPSLSTELLAQEAKSSSNVTVPPGKTRAEVPAIRDVRLQSNGGLQLRILDTAGKPHAGEAVQCLYQGKIVAAGKTDATGTVKISQLRPGIHSFAVGQAQTAYRLWNSATAPPSAISSPAIVASTETLRGQYGYGYGGQPMMAPGMLATGVTIAAVVAVIAGKSSGSDSAAAPPASP